MAKKRSRKQRTNANAGKNSNNSNKSKIHHEDSDDEPLLGEVSDNISKNEPEIKKTVKGIKELSMQPPKGLNNLGNTCFFNSVMQNLCRTPGLICALQKSQNQETIVVESEDIPTLHCKLPSLFKLSQALLDFLITMNQDVAETTNTTTRRARRQTRSRIESPRALFNQICAMCPRFRGFQQQDSQELLRTLLDGIKTEEIKRRKQAILTELNLRGKRARDVDPEVRSKIKAYGQVVTSEPTIIDTLFSGTLVSSVLCDECGKITQVTEEFLDISLPIVEGVQAHHVNESMRKNQKSSVCEDVQGKDENISALEDSKPPSTPSTSKYAKKKNRKMAKKGHRRGGRGRNSSYTEAPDAMEETEIKDIDCDADNEVKVVAPIADDDTEVSKALKDQTVEEKEDVTPITGHGTKLENEMPQTNASATDVQNVMAGMENGATDSNDATAMSNDIDLVSKIEKLNLDPKYTPKDPSTMELENLGDKVNGNDGSIAINSTENIAEVEINENNANVTCTNTPIITSIMDDEMIKFKANDIVHEILKDAVSNFSRELISAHSLKEEFTSFSTANEIGDHLTDIPLHSDEFSSKNVIELNNNNPHFLSKMKFSKTTEISCEIDEIKTENHQNTVISEEECHENESNNEEMKNSNEVEMEEGMGSGKVSKGGILRENLTSPVESRRNSVTSEHTEPSSGNDEKELSDEKKESHSEIIPSLFETPARQPEVKFTSFCSKLPTSLGPRYEGKQQECSIQSCLHKFTMAEMLTGNNKYGCDECTKLQSKGQEKPKTVYCNASKQMLVSHPPLILTLHMKRFQQSGRNLRKFSKRVTIPVEFDLAPFCSSGCVIHADENKQILYRIFGIVEHSGSLSRGHYTAYVNVRPENKDILHNLTEMENGHGPLDTTEDEELDPVGTWYHISDTSVSKCTLDRALNSNAYLIFYERQF